MISCFERISAACLCPREFVSHLHLKPKLELLSSNAKSYMENKVQSYGRQNRVENIGSRLN